MANSELVTRVSLRLVDARVDEPYCVIQVQPSRRAVLSQEGIVEGCLITIERRLALGGPLIVRLGRTRLAIARNVGADVLVEPPAGPPSDSSA